MGWSNHELGEYNGAQAADGSRLQLADYRGTELARYRDAARNRGISDGLAGHIPEHRHEPWIPEHGDEPW